MKKLHKFIHNILLRKDGFHKLKIDNEKYYWKVYQPFSWSALRINIFDTETNRYTNHLCENHYHQKNYNIKITQITTELVKHIIKNNIVDMDDDDILEFYNRNIRTKKLKKILND